MVLLISIFCSLCLRRHSKQEKLISAVRDVSILLFTYYTIKKTGYLEASLFYYELLLDTLQKRLRAWMR